jgi:fermentation-respiration switch protein FrsA (DUF1100 family)
LVSPFTSIVDMARRVVGSVASLVIADLFENARKVPELDLPVTVIHGTADTVVPYDHGQKLAALARHGRLVTLEGADHVDLPGLDALVAEAVTRPGA